MRGQKELYSLVQAFCFSCSFISHSLPTFSHDSGSQSWLSDSHCPSHTYRVFFECCPYLLFGISVLQAAKQIIWEQSLLIRTSAHRAKEFTDVISISCDYLYFLETLAQAKWFFFIYCFSCSGICHVLGFVWKHFLKGGDSTVYGHYLTE